MTFFVLPAIMNNINISCLEIQEGKHYIYISHTLHKYLSSVKKKNRYMSSRMGFI